MKKVALAVFVKTPGYSPLKTRLAKSIGQEKAENFYRLSVKMTEQMILKAKELNPDIDAFWSVAEPEAGKEEMWKGFPVISQGTGDLGDRLHHVYSNLKKDYEVVILLGADSPHLDFRWIAKSAELLSLKGTDFVMGPTYDGGFYLFAGRHEIGEEIWKSVEYSRDTTRKQLEEALQSKGKFFNLAPNFDIDTKEDLDRLMSLPGVEQNFSL